MIQVLEVGCRSVKNKHVFTSYLAVFMHNTSATYYFNIVLGGIIMIGLSFKVKNEYNNFLYKIFNSIDVQNYLWTIVSDDVIFPEKDYNDGLFASEMLNGKEFLSAIAKDTYYMIFIDLKAFPADSKQTEIQSFKDFIDSDCQMILLCVDSEFIEFYCKNRSILKTVYDNCLKYEFEEVEWISEITAQSRSMIAF
jgi:hypothetical protein